MSNISGFHWRYYNNTWSLISYCYVGDKCFDFMTTSYGKIKIKNDGRFEWFVVPNDYGHKSYKNKEYKQGVTKTLDGAKAKILSFFGKDIINPLEITYLEDSKSFCGPYN